MVDAKEYREALSKIMKDGPYSQSWIVRKSGLSASVISKIFAQENPTINEKTARTLKYFIEEMKDFDGRP